jgi:hypothetical protein
MAAAVVVASPVGSRFERSVLRGIYPGRANEVDRCLNSKGVRRRGTGYYTYYSACSLLATYLRRDSHTAAYCCLCVVLTTHYLLLTCAGM